MEIKAQSPDADILNDRSIYALAEQTVKLFDKLQAVIAAMSDSHAATGGSGCS
jgi:hypothetical protein